MTPHEWERIKQIFDAALAEAPGNRAAFLQSNCGDDSAIRSEVERLLAARTQSHVSHSGRLSGGEFQSMAFVIVPGAQVNGVAFAAAFGHPHDVGEEAQAGIGLRR